jgi:hypothetical protein
MPIFRIEGTKGDHQIAEQAPSATKADWVAAFYREAGYKVTITEVTPLTSGSL